MPLCFSDLKLRQATKQRLENVNDRDQEIEHLKKDNKRKAQLIATYQQTLSKHRSTLAIQNGTSTAPRTTSTTASISRCPYCPKAFESPHFLQRHIQRKHSGREQYPIPDQNRMPEQRAFEDERDEPDPRHSANIQASVLTRGCPTPYAIIIRPSHSRPPRASLATLQTLLR